MLFASGSIWNILGIRFMFYIVEWGKLDEICLYHCRCVFFSYSFPSRIPFHSLTHFFFVLFTIFHHPLFMSTSPAPSFITVVLSNLLFNFIDLYQGMSRLYVSPISTFLFSLFYPCLFSMLHPVFELTIEYHKMNGFWSVSPSPWNYSSKKIYITKN